MRRERRCSQTLKMDLRESVTASRTWKAIDGCLCSEVRYSMRYLSLIIILLASVWFCVAQNKTIVLVRHAERAPDTEMDKGDPDLSAEGKQRAIRLVKIAKKYKPHEIF